MYLTCCSLFVLFLVCLHVDSVLKGRTFDSATERKRIYNGMLTHTDGLTQAQWVDLEIENAMLRDTLSALEDARRTLLMGEHTCNHG